MDFNRFGQQPCCRPRRRARAGDGPPQPQGPPPPDEWMRRLGTLPLEAQPGQRWLYHLGADVLGVLVARADRPVAGGCADRSGARTARDGRHAVLRARRIARPLRARFGTRPGLGRALDLRRGGRSVEPAAGVPVRRCRAGVDDRRLPRVRADAQSRRAARGHAAGPRRAGGRDDDEPAHRPIRSRPAASDVVGRPGVRVLRGRPRCATPPTAATRAPTGGAAASGATGTRTRSTTRSASCSPTRCSTAPSSHRSARSCSAREPAPRRSRCSRICAADCSGRLVRRVDVEARRRRRGRVSCVDEAVDRVDVGPLVPADLARARRPARAAPRART